jgi:hypothetical protein
MQRSCRSLTCLLPGVMVVSFLAVAAAGAERESPAQIQARLRALPDERLSERLDELLSAEDFRREFEYEACLTEIVRRAQDEWAAQLQRHVDALAARVVDRFDDDDDGKPGSCWNLELLTALRRVQQKPDPLRIIVDAPDDRITTPQLSLPHLKVAIKNVDVDRQDAGFIFGGDYRSGRQARWRVVVVDADNKPVPMRGNRSFIAGGQFQEGVLERGESWETVLDLRRFIVAPPPGLYSLQVFYHNTRRIAHRTDLSGLIVCRSAPIVLEVEQTVIDLTKSEHQTAQAWIAQIDPEKELVGVAGRNANQGNNFNAIFARLDVGIKVKVIAGTYGEWAHEFIPPNSPQGKLLAMGLKSAPALIEALQQQQATTVEKRAWILALLYSLTGERDPREASAVGWYEALEGPWQVYGGKPGEGEAGGFGFASKMIGGPADGKINAKAQQELAKQWADWLETVKVNMRDATS